MPVPVPAPLAQTRRTVGPLSAAERETLLRALADLKRELRVLVGALPVPAQTASGMARLLGVERTTCQRVVAAISTTETTPDLVAQLPGVRGLATLIDAAAPRLPDALGPAAARSTLEAVRSAVAGFDETVRRLGGSQSRLIRRTRATGPHAASSRDAVAIDDARAELFKAAELVTGRSSDLWIAAHVFAPCPGRADLLRHTRAHGLVGHRAAPDAVPLTVHVFGDDLDAGDANAPEANRFRPLRRGRADALLPEFSTDPAPLVRCKAPGEHIVQTIDADAAAADAAVDLLFGLDGAISHPARRDQTFEEVWALVNFPVRRMVFDVYLHRDLARACLPALDHHLWRPDFASQVGERWQTRFARPPRLEVLPPGDDGPHTDAWPRHVELVGTLFDHVGGRATDFVGYRCDIPFPVWRTGYRITLDFGER
jgi:hypothetical protein